MALMTSSQPNMTLKYFNSKLYRFRAQPFKIQLLDFLGQISRPFTTLPTRETFACLFARWSGLVGQTACSRDGVRRHEKRPSSRRSPPGRVCPSRTSRRGGEPRASPSSCPQKEGRPRRGNLHVLGSSITIHQQLDRSRRMRHSHGGRQGARGICVHKAFACILGVTTPTI